MPKTYWVYLGLCLLGTAAAYLWLDQPIAIWAAKHLPYHPSSILHRSFATTATQTVYYLLILLFCLYYWKRCRGENSKVMRCISLLAVGAVFGYFVKNQLQFLFGRYLPRYPESGRLLFERSPDLYGFHWWQMGCFPSGHMTIFTAMITSICLIFPKFRWPGALLLLLLAASLILANFHFLSDVIAGFLLGGAIAVGIYRLYQPLGRYSA